MADNNSVLTIVLVVAAFLLLSGNLTGNQIRNAPGVASREEFGRPSGSQIANICYSERFRTEIADGDYKAGAVPSTSVSYVIDLCDKGVLKEFACKTKPLSLGAGQYYGGSQKRTTESLLDIGCTEITNLGTIFQESSL